MLSLLILWAVFFILCLSISSYLNVREEPIFTRFLIGVALLSVYLQVWAIFFPVKMALLPLFLGIGLIFFKKDLRIFIRETVENIQKSVGLKEIVLLMMLLFIASLPGYINDEAAYYQQTIKWLSEYGFVLGIANLKMHLGLGSSWHLIISAFYFEQLPVTRYYNFNGLVLWVLFISLSKQFPRYSLVTISVLILIGSLFVNAPSPDLLVICGTVWILMNIRKLKPLHFAYIVGFLITVKISAAGLLLFIFPVLKNKSYNLSKVLLVFLTFFILFLTRNILLTGHAFFPLEFIGGIGDHQVPVELLKAFRYDVLNEILDNFNVTTMADYHTDYVERFRSLFAVRRYKILMNGLVILAFVVTPVLLILKKKRNKLILGLIIIINGLLWFLYAPNYRFALGYLIFMFFVLNNFLIKESWIPKAKYFLFFLTVVAVLFLNLNLYKVIYNVDCGENQQLSLKTIFIPADFPEVKYKKEGEFNVTNCSYCYDIPIPCYSDPVMGRYIKDQGYEPILAAPGQPEEGFIMKKIN